MRSNLFTLILICVSVIANAQKKQEVLDFIEKLPTIEYGVRPYWSGRIDEYKSFVHGYPYSYKDTLNVINNKLMTQALCDSSYVIIDGKRFPVEMHNVEFVKKYNFDKWSYAQSVRREFYPGLYASAKSIYNGKYYVVYFWSASVTENVYYYALVFDFDGNLLSYQHFDYWVLVTASYPFDSPDNYKRITDYAKTQVKYLPNGLLLVEDVDITAGDGFYELMWLNDDGHYEKLTKWDEYGELDGYKGTKYENHVRYAEDEETHKPTVKSFSLIPFLVQDKDGYTNIRKAGSSSSEIIRTINDGEVVFGTFLDNGWVKIEFSAEHDGKIIKGGYIHSSRLKKLSNEYNELALPSHEEWVKSLKK